MYLNLIISLFSLLPLSMILGNFIINLNIILIDLIFLFVCLTQKKWEWCKDKFFLFISIFYLYLIVNSVLNYYQNPSYEIDGIIRSISFVKFILFLYSFQLLIPNKDALDKVIFFWLCTVSIVIFDVFFEKYFGFNTLGFKSLNSTRIISFFYDESIVGSFLFCFGFISCTYFLQENNNSIRNRTILNFLIFFILIAVFFSGERSNFIKSLFLFSLIILLISSEKLLVKKYILFIILLISLVSSTLISKTIYVKQTEFFKRIFIKKDAQNFSDRISNIKYFAHYDTAWRIFLNYPINGISSKNFRHECKKIEYFNKNLKHSINRCNTHPHQVHFELLSEHGLIGYILFFYLIFLQIRKNFFYHKKNIFFLSINLYILIFLIPILPSGSIFSSTSGLTFWIIFSLLNYFNKKFN